MRQGQPLSQSTCSEYALKLPTSPESCALCDIDVKQIEGTVRPDDLMSGKAGEDGSLWAFSRGMEAIKEEVEERKKMFSLCVG